MRWGRIWCSGVCGIDDAFVRGGPSSVPAAVATLLPDAGVVFGLIARVAKIGKHVGPETLVLRGHKARQVVAGFDLAVTTQVIPIVQSLALGKGELVPPFHKVAQSCVHLTIIDSACQQVLVLVDLQLKAAETFRSFCVDVLHVGHLGEASVHLHLLDGVDQRAKGPLLHQLLPYHLGPNHDVRVAEGVLGVAGRACARLGAPVAQAPAAQEHDEPEPGSHCRWGCCSPLQSCRERRRRACCSSSSPARPSGATLGSGALPSECPEGREGARGGCWALAHDSAGWRTLRAKEWELEQEVSRPRDRKSHV